MGRPRAVDDTDLIPRLVTAFRTNGYDGTSLTDLATSTGLKSASLYHRFPGGKLGMAAAVLDDVERQFGVVLEPLTTSAEPANGVREMARRVATFYADGRLACVLDTMTLDGSPAEVRHRASLLARGWIDAMTDVAVRAGADPHDGGRRAREALVRIEGALVVSRVLDDTAEFSAALASLPDLLTGATTPPTGRHQP